MHKLLCLIVLLAAMPAFAQLESHTLTISANRQINLQPDQVLFDVTVSSSAAVSLDQIVAALSGLSVTSANLTGVSNFTAPQTLQWTFTLARPLSNLTQTIGSLAKVQQTLAQGNSGISLTFSIEGTHTSQQQQPQSCSTSDLIADATAQAHNLAAAAGYSVGPIRRLSNAPLIEPTPALMTCSLVVEFQLQQ